MLTVVFSSFKTKGRKEKRRILRELFVNIEYYLLLCEKNGTLVQTLFFNYGMLISEAIFGRSPLPVLGMRFDFLSTDGKSFLENIRNILGKLPFQKRGGPLKSLVGKIPERSGIKSILSRKLKDSHALLRNSLKP